VDKREKEFWKETWANKCDKEFTELREKEAVVWIGSIVSLSQPQNGRLAGQTLLAWFRSHRLTESSA
jgi:hypothetical protein